MGGNNKLEGVGKGGGVEVGGGVGWVKVWANQDLARRWVETGKWRGWSGGVETRFSSGICTNITPLPSTHEFVT